MRVCLVVNPRARRGRGVERSLREALERHGVEIVSAGDPKGIDGLVVAGGDGTFVGSIARALELRVPMGLVPLGTFNDLARTLGLPFDLDAACATIAEGKTRRIDVARVNGSYYVNEASIGLSSRIARLQNSDEKQRLGLLAVFISVVRAFRLVRSFTAQIGYGRSEARVKAIQITVANSHRFGGLINVEDAAIDDGLLDCYVVEGQGFVPILALLMAFMRRRPPPRGAIRTFRASAFRVVTRGHRRIVADGEPAGRSPARFEVLPRALEVFVPAP